MVRRCTFSCLRRDLGLPFYYWRPADRYREEEPGFNDPVDFPENVDPRKDPSRLHKLVINKWEHICPSDMLRPCGKNSMLYHQSMICHRSHSTYCPHRCSDFTMLWLIVHVHSPSKVWCLCSEGVLKVKGRCCKSFWSLCSATCLTWWCRFDMLKLLSLLPWSAAVESFPSYVMYTLICRNLSIFYVHK